MNAYRTLQREWLSDISREVVKREVHAVMDEATKQFRKFYAANVRDGSLSLRADEAFDRLDVMKIIRLDVPKLTYSMAVPEYLESMRR